MAIILKLSEQDFIDEFAKYGKEYSKQFSIEALRALYGYLDDFSNDTSENIEFDVISLCCDFSEYAKDELTTKDYQDLHIIKISDDNYLVRH